jgi:hypothetical protein
VKKFVSRSLAGMLCLLVAPASLFAQSARGDISHQVNNVMTAIVFDVAAAGSAARGEMTLTDTTTLVQVKVAFDCLVVNGNRAAASGLVTSATLPEYVGKRGLLIVEDNSRTFADNTFLWGLYKGPETRWIATDAEREIDPGAGLVWQATDAERPDDKPVSSRRPEPGDCRGVSLAALDREELVPARGTLQVIPQ